jgi:hypothetical protein
LFSLILPAQGCPRAPARGPPAPCRRKGFLNSCCPGFPQGPRPRPGSLRPPPQERQRLCRPSLSPPIGRVRTAAGTEAPWMRMIWPTKISIWAAARVGRGRADIYVGPRGPVWAPVCPTVGPGPGCRERIQCKRLAEGSKQGITFPIARRSHAKDPKQAADQQRRPQTTGCRAWLMKVPTPPPERFRV